MLFFQILLDKSEYFEKDPIKEEFNVDLFEKNLDELSNEKDIFHKKTIELIDRYQKQNYRLSFLSEKEMLKFVKSFQIPKVIYFLSNFLNFFF